MIDILKSFLITLAIAVCFTILGILVYLIACTLHKEYIVPVSALLTIFLGTWFIVYCELYM